MSTSFDAAVEARRNESVVLCLYISGPTPRSAQALVQVRSLCEAALHGRAVIQLTTNPAQNGTAQRGDGGAFHSIV